MSVSEKRHLERFELNIPALVESSGRMMKRAKACLLARDLSGQGAFFFTPNPLPVNSSVSVDIILAFCGVPKAPDNSYSLIQVEGVVLRSESNGMAVGFTDTFRISPIENM